jgi:hypothetical protein
VRAAVRGFRRTRRGGCDPAAPDPFPGLVSPASRPRSQTKASGGKAIILDYGGNLLRHGLPNMEPAWSLDGKPKCRADAAAGEAPVKSCPCCTAAVALAATICAGCGFVWPPPPVQLVENHTGQRIKVDAITVAALAGAPLRQLLPMCRSRSDLHAIAQARGFKPGWAFYAAKELGL